MATSLAGAACTSSGSTDVRYAGEVRVSSPELIEIEPGVQVIADADEPLFYADNSYWLYRDGYWLRSGDYRGGFARVEVTYVPERVRRIEQPQMYVQYRRHMGAGHDVHGGNRAARGQVRQEPMRSPMPPQGTNTYDTGTYETPTPTVPESAPSVPTGANPTPPITSPGDIHGSPMPPHQAPVTPNPADRPGPQSVPPAAEPAHDHDARDVEIDHGARDSRDAKSHKESAPGQAGKADKATGKPDDDDKRRGKPDDDDKDRGKPDRDDERNKR